MELAEAAIEVGWMSNGEHLVELPYPMVEKMVVYITSRLHLCSNFPDVISGEAKSHEQFKLGILYSWLSQNDLSDVLVLA